MSDLITPDLVRLDASLGDSKPDVIRSLAAVVGDAGRATDVDQLVADAFAREEQSATGLPGGLAIPHCRTTGVEEPTLAFARLRPGVDFGAKDGPADLVFLIAAPAGGDADHLTILTQLARALVKPAFTDSLRAAETSEDVVALVRRELGLDPTPAPAAEPRGTRHTRCCRRDPGRSTGRSRHAVPGRRHRLPDRHRPHLHGRRGPRGRRRAGRGGDRGRDPGFGRLDPARSRDHRRGRGRDLRGRRGRARPGPLRRQADGELRGEAPDRRRRRDDRRGAALRRRSVQRPARRGHGQRVRRRHRRQAVLRCHDPSGPDDRRLLHDPVRRRRRPADRPGILARWLRDRAGDRGRCRSGRTGRRRLDAVQPRRPGLLRPRRQRQPAARCVADLPRRAAADPRRRRVRVPGPGPCRLHRLRHRRPPRHRAGLRHGRHRGHAELGLPRWHRRRRSRRTDRPLDHVLEGPDVDARADAGAGHPAAHHAAGRLRDGRRAGSPAGEPDDQPRRRPQQSAGRFRGRARHHPRPDDGLRHGRPAEQDGVRLRHRWARCRRRRPPTLPSST